MGLTDAVLSNKGVPVKYLGDGFLAYFSGQRYTHRSVKAALQMRRISVDPNLVVTISEGPIYLGPIGVGDYARPDIIGDAVNTAFLLNQWVANETNLSSVGTFLTPEKVGITDPTIATMRIGTRPVHYITIE